VVNEKIRPWRSLNWPNRITILRLMLVAPFVVLVMNQNQPRWEAARHAALVIFLVMAVSDLVDGTLARRLNARTRLGAILDPLADKALIICSVVLLSLPRSAVPGAQLPDWVVVVIVGKDLWVIVGFLVICLVTDRFRIQPTGVGKACMDAQLIMVMLVLLAPELNRLAEGLGARLAGVASWTAAAISVLAVISYTRLGLGFIAEGAKPLEEAPRKEQAGHGPH
jgi:cardiolipin synthase